MTDLSDCLVSLHAPYDPVRALCMTIDLSALIDSAPYSPKNKVLLSIENNFHNYYYY